MGWFEDLFDDTLDVMADAVVGVSCAVIDTAVKARQAGVTFPPGEVVADFWDVDMEEAVSAAENEGQCLLDEEIDADEQVDELASNVDDVDDVDDEGDDKQRDKYALTVPDEPVEAVPDYENNTEKRRERW